MDLVSLRMITADVDGMVGFSERITGVVATRHTAQFAELTLPSATLAIGHVDTLRAFGDAAFARPAHDRTVIIDFKVDDVDGEYERLEPLVDEWVQPPTTMPWGNRSILFRDPDGNLVDYFTTVTASASAKFDR